MFQEKKLAFGFALVAVLVLSACAGVVLPEVGNGNSSNENPPWGAPPWGAISMQMPIPMGKAIQS